jgi:hypothetical protein
MAMIDVKMKGSKKVNHTISNQKKVNPFYKFIMIFISLFLIGCAPSWTPSDKEAAKHVRDYYLFYNSGETVQATVAKRGKFMEECECYPIVFKIIFSNGRNNNKTFYFFKNGSGNIEANEFMKR